MYSEVLLLKDFGRPWLYHTFRLVLGGNPAAYQHSPVTGSLADHYGSLPEARIKSGEAVWIGYLIKKVQCDSLRNLEFQFIAIKFQIFKEYGLFIQLLITRKYW